MTEHLTFTCAGETHRIALDEECDDAILGALSAWLPAEVTIHCAKIAGSHIYWPSPILARPEARTDIHTLPPGSLLYYPERQYLEIVYDALQAEKVSVVPVGKLLGDIAWLRDFADRQRRQSGFVIETGTLSFEASPDGEPNRSADVKAGDDTTAWGRIQTARRAVWAREPAELLTLYANRGLNLPYGAMMTAEGYFRTTQETLWRVWSAPEWFSDAQRRAIAVSACELAITRVGHFCHLNESAKVFEDGITVIEEQDVPLDDVLAELIRFAGRMSNWIDVRIPWFEINEVTKRALGG